MKVLFLDIDGVANSAEDAKATRGVLGISPEKAFIIGKIILDTDCKVVISSSWRNWPEGMEQIKQQIYPDIYDITPNSHLVHYEDKPRGTEIKTWLSQHPEVTRYAILDDDSDFFDDQPLFKTTWEKGITPEIARKVTDYLNGKE